VKPYLLDTNIVSYFIKGSNPSLHSRMKQVLQDQDAMISVVTRAELRYSQALMSAKDIRREQIDLLLDQIAALPWTDSAADVYGPLKARLRQQGTPIGELDAQIAAQALAQGLILVTHNISHFEKVVGLEIEDWT
jgi:tRNA(fMet)-specific endonuclease VapC